MARVSARLFAFSADSLQNLPRQHGVNERQPPSCNPSVAQVQPVLQRLKRTLTGSGAALLLSSALLFGLIRAGSDADGVYGSLSRAPVLCGISRLLRLLSIDLWGFLPSTASGRVWSVLHHCHCRPPPSSATAYMRACHFNAQLSRLELGLYYAHRPRRCIATRAGPERHHLLEGGAGFVRPAG